MGSSGLLKFCQKCDKETSHRGVVCRRCYEKELKLNNPTYKQNQAKAQKKWRNQNKKKLKEYFELRKESSFEMERIRGNQRAYTARKRGLTKEAFDSLLKFQNNTCPICLNTFSKTRYLDHDHKTGKARGFLCSPCNSGIGFLQEDEDQIERALMYLRHPPAKNFIKE